MATSHECDILRKTKVKISIDNVDNQWLWVYWDDKNGNTAHGIKYCPYCGEELLKESRENV